MKRLTKPMVDTGRKCAPLRVRVSCTRYVLRERASDGSDWTSEPIDGDDRHATQNVVAGMPGVGKGGLRWAETLNGELVAGDRP